jgi:hypothetical protein
MHLFVSEVARGGGERGVEPMKGGEKTGVCIYDAVGAM